MSRADSILGRFPAHFEALKPGKVLRSAVAALARDLDVQAAELAAIRRSHRLFDADELSDLLLIAARHGIMASSLELVTMRFERARSLLKDLAAPADEAVWDAAAARLLSLWSIEGDEPKLALFADPNEDGSPVDLTGEAGVTATARLVAAATAASSRKSQNNAARTRIATTTRIAASGNGTVRALLSGAANALDLDIGPIRSSEDRYPARHLRARPADAQVRRRQWPDRACRRARGDRTGGEPALPDGDRCRAAQACGAVRPAAPRIERATLQIRVTSEAERTVGPMVVNRDEGHGVGFAGSVPGGDRLDIPRGRPGQARRGRCHLVRLCLEGRLFRRCVEPSFQRPGLCRRCGRAARRDLCGFFPDGGARLRLRLSSCRRQSSDAGCLRRPHPLRLFRSGGARLAGPHARFAWLARRVPPRPAVGFLDGSVFAPGPGETREPSALVSFSWFERRAHAVRILIPPRFRALEDDPEAPEVRRRLVETVGRFRPVGILVEAAFLDDCWTLGEGAMSAAAADDPVEALRGGTVLWSAPEQGGT